jgi:hypothetical protein
MNNPDESSNSDSDQKEPFIQKQPYDSDSSENSSDSSNSSSDSSSESSDTEDAKMTASAYRKSRVRQGPAAHAKSFAGRKKRGSDGKWWRSTADKNGVYRWKRVSVREPRINNNAATLHKRSRQAPPVHAQDFGHRRKKGADGKWWRSVPDKNGVFHWHHLKK